MKKLSVIIILVLLLVSCGTKTEIKIQDVKNKKVILQKYMDLTKYIKTDITDKQSEKLLNILDFRKEKQNEIKNLIEKSTKENASEIYEKIIKIRKGYLDNILIYVSDLKKGSFLKYNARINFLIKNKLNNK